MKRGLVWTALDKYSGQIISTCISMVLARLLTPYDYGVVATASVLLGFLSIFSTIGIFSAVVQRKDLTRKDLDNIFTFTILLGLTLGGLFFLCSWKIAEFYGNPLLRPVVQILSLGLFLSTINQVPSALMSKNLRFKEVATRSLVFQVFFGLVGIVAALKGAGVYALVFPQILSSICTFFYNRHFYPVHVSLHFDLTPIKRIFSYSAYLFFFDILNYFSRNLDKLIIGKYISPSSLGYYEKGYRMMQMPMHNITGVVYPVLQPVLSNYQDDMIAMADKHNKLVARIAMLSFPMGVLMFFNAPDIISIMYGNRWEAAIPVFSILALSVPTQVILSTSGAIFQSCNRTKTQFVCGVFSSVITVCAFLSAAHFVGTIEAIAWGWTLPSIINFFFCYWMMYHKVFHSKLSVLFKNLYHPFVNALLLVALYGLFGLLSWEMPAILSLILRMGAGVLLTLAFIQYTGQYNVKAKMLSKLKK